MQFEVRILHGAGQFMVLRLLLWLQSVPPLAQDLANRTIVLIRMLLVHHLPVFLGKDHKGVHGSPDFLVRRLPSRCSCCSRLLLLLLLLVVDMLLERLLLLLLRCCCCCCCLLLLLLLLMMGCCCCCCCLLLLLLLLVSCCSSSKELRMQRG